MLTTSIGNCFANSKEILVFPDAVGQIKKIAGKLYL